ncbi:hypothetical protein HAX54_022427 [Datura stramonium]|uniref:Uncharacterized protein n=1 Tax=Datura stramonium TaxID=4076 RepID=A0ABS8UUJ1_DATST|nr:hypothetical protein [Datura stramonium]
MSSYPPPGYGAPSAPPPSGYYGDQGYPLPPGAPTYQALNDQEELQDKLEKSTPISQRESHRSEKKMPDKEDNVEESHEENSQTTGEKPEINQVKGIGEGNKEVVIWTSEEKDNIELKDGSPNPISIVVHEGGNSEASKLLELNERQ